MPRAGKTFMRAIKYVVLSGVQAALPKAAVHAEQQVGPTCCLVALQVKWL